MDKMQKQLIKNTANWEFLPLIRLIGFIWVNYESGNRGI
jgi:hypothetical protein